MEKSNLKKELKKGITFGIGFTIVLSCLFLVSAVGFHIADEITSGSFTGNYSFTGDVNLSLANVSGLNLGSIPSTAIMSFYSNTCPSGWIPADGTSGTPDLRGVIVRGMETFDGGTTYNNRDDGRSGNLTLGTYQDDEFQSHTHTYSQGASRDATSGGSKVDATSGNRAFRTKTTNSAGGSETRPKNVALIYCMKQ